MITVAKSLAAVVALAAIVLAPQSASGDSLVNRAPAADISKFLPSLPGEVPWLTALRRTPAPAFAALPEAGSVSALLLSPQPARLWAPPAQAASLPSAVAGM